MVFASLTPPWLRRFVLPIVCITSTSIPCFGATAFLTVQSTPYDRQMIRVFPVLSSADMQGPDSISSLGVSHLMMQLRNMPYQYSSRWQTPMEVDLAQAADCKGKAVALYAQMRRNGAKNVRVVIGRRHMFDSGTHAWLEWQTKEGSYVLDPTFNDMPTRTAEFGSATYVPLYAYDGAHKYRANAAGSVMPSAKVATGIYVPARDVSTLAKPALAGVGPKPSVSSPPVRVLATQHLQRNAQHTVSTTRRSSSNVGSRPTVSLPPVRVPATQHLQLNAQRTVSTTRRSSPNVGSRRTVSSTPARTLASQHLQLNAQRTVSTTRRLSSNVGSRPLLSSTPARTLTTQHRQLNAQRTVSTTRRSSLNVGSRPSVSLTPVQTIATQHRQSNTQRSLADARRSPPNLEGVRRPNVVVAASKAKSVVASHRKGALTQNGHARHTRRAISSTARRRHVRGPVISQNERYVIPMDLTRLP